MYGAQILIQSLIEQEVDTIFGYPGGAVLPIYDALFDCNNINHILVRHEQAAVHAADGYARVTGKPGVALVTSGPGATNAVTGIATAYMDSVPMVIMTGQVSTNLLGLDSFQEVDIYGMTMNITKHNYMVMDIADLPRIIKDAFHIANTGRPGPVLIDFPKNIMTNKMDLALDELKGPIHIQGYEPCTSISYREFDEIVEKIESAHSPVLVAGGGCLAGDGPSLLFELATRCDIPVTSTLMGIGSFPVDHPLYLGMVGMHGTVAANRAVQGADVLICLGMRFSDRVTGNKKSFSPKSFKIQVDIDPAELNKNVHVDLAVSGAVDDALRGILLRVPPNKHLAWHEKLDGWSKQAPSFKYKKDNSLTPQEVIHYIDAATAENAIISTDVGQHQIWTAHHYTFTKPRSFLTSGGLGTMGYGFPAAIGAAVANPDRQVVCISGDGSFQMNMQEIMTAVDLRINVKVAILKNGYLGMVRQWQQLFLNNRYSAVRISSPDFASLAKSFGAHGFTARTIDEARNIIDLAINTEGPVIMEFYVNEEANVYPIVPPGASNQDMIED
ncbi:biosynthetic-type acetolactate synthase large subunit [Bacillus sp. FJAT-49711]|uniref:biosynthetic-type acetolactate synthase large subunit n=1 Tax=Bacillus sp. FJAT-49711 TaxID=2833585 RepID=UPI001BC8CD19|nr:biosynthetic-type acetolactate synthase large subunit [Bacillus sp. FJAT-49711]MBS4219533.1 biosynthetic-type acetolactate synthase large subunit [Bacillus sp. FJAT-49711]